MKLLPRGEAKKLARIEGRDGAPDPERWHFLVHDETSETGLREYVIAAGEVVASRNLSQFAETLAEEDVIGGDAVKFDSDKAARLAQLFAAANTVSIGTIHYQLHKAGADAAPLWTLTCLEAGGRELGRLVVSATKGTVISHDGFAIEPPLPTPAPATPSPLVKAKPKPKPTKPEVPVATPIPVDAPAPDADRPGFFDRVRGSLQKVLPGKKTEER